jgi:hypothetical protein
MAEYWFNHSAVLCIFFAVFAVKPSTNRKEDAKLCKGMQVQFTKLHQRHG